jgi:hypothetical protein
LALRFRKSFRLFPGVRLNVGARGVSATFGVPGASVNVGPKGSRLTVGVPGSGISFSTKLSGPPLASPSSGARSSASQQDHTPSDEPLPQVWTPHQGTREIGSAGVEELTSTSLQDFKQLLQDAAKQRRSLQAEHSECLHQLTKASQERAQLQSSLFSFFRKKRIAEISATVEGLRQEIDQIDEWLESTHVDAQFQTSTAASRTYGALVRAYDALLSCSSTWDVTSERDVDRPRERSAASRNVERKAVKLAYATSPLLRFEGSALFFKNANGDDLYFYPSLVLMPRRDGQFALIDYADLRIAFQSVTFIEAEAVPPDAQITGKVWAKTNKDGSPDRRFKGNHEIPLCLYGKLLLETDSGLCEEYQFSNVDSARAFAEAFVQHQAALREVD